MLLHAMRAQPGKMVSPGADDARDKSLVNQAENPLVRLVEILGTDTGIILLPGEACFIGPARIEGRHVGVQSGHDLNHTEALGLTVGSQLPEFLWPMEPLAKSHPPRIPQPEERRPIQVLKVPSVGGDSHGAANDGGFCPT